VARNWDRIRRRKNFSKCCEENNTNGRSGVVIGLRAYLREEKHTDADCATGLDAQITDTSLILLFTVGDKSTPFPGIDAQMGKLVLCTQPTGSSRETSASVDVLQSRHQRLASMRHQKSLLEPKLEK